MELSRKGKSWQKAAIVDPGTKISWSLLITVGCHLRPVNTRSQCVQLTEPARCRSQRIAARFPKAPPVCIGCWRLLRSRPQQVIAAWGVVGGHQNRCVAVLEMISGFGLLCLKKTKEGYPNHPLYVAADTEPTKYIG